ncbi:MAG: hypothetical protein P1P87_01855 [Trueperaceae bacterium]|nr:hypothetical protein [Trueperaceae bacterium]
MISEIDALMRSSLTSLVEDVSAADWTGRREREIVSLFCFGRLVRHCRPGAFSHDPTQIAIEVAVPQVDRQTRLSGNAGSKGQVCKDIVLWPRSRLTCWDATGAPTVMPASVIEWKHGVTEWSGRGVEWLMEFSTRSGDFVGYAVWINRGSTHAGRLMCTRVHQGQAERRWMAME